MSDTKQRTVGEVLGLTEADVLQGVIASLRAEIRSLKATITAEEADHRRWEERANAAKDEQYDEMLDQINYYRSRWESSGGVTGVGRSKRIDRSIKVLCESCGHDITER